MAKYELEIYWVGAPNERSTILLWLLVLEILHIKFETSNRLDEYTRSCEFSTIDVFA